MPRCATCGNNYLATFEVRMEGKSFHFDCFECAIHKLAPRCVACGCTIIGHRIRSSSRIFCSPHCARTWNRSTLTAGPDSPLGLGGSGALVRD